MRVYHRTDHAEAIMQDGFRDGGYLLPTLGEQRGVFVSADEPLNVNEGAEGDTVLEVDIPYELFRNNEWIEEGKPYREAMIPAADLNKCPRRVLSEEEVEALSEASWQRWARRRGLA